ncbi:c-type cytochrome biogenesis protein CcmI [Ostreiculturibacter nitratireducens]|uniref:c-type cytochrome biogenesis protein CcmI n=1 Tax=Ostreiculturibacter nitratireducens TaxID=3075226 RepID=UPI0031B5851D
MLFWIFAALLSAAIAAILVLAALRGGRDMEPAAAYDLRIYRDQLKEVDRDLARGVIRAEDAERAKTEISRRILEADKALAAGEAAAAGPRALTIGLSAVMAAVVVAGGLALYFRIGAPGYPDLPIERRKEMAEAARSARVGQAEAQVEAAALRGPLPEVDPQFADLMEKLRAAVASRPDDLQGLGLLARNEAAVGNFDAAIAAQERIIEVKGDAATAEDSATLADLMVLAAGGYVSPEAEAAAEAALALDARNGTARYYLGLMHAQTGRPDLAFGFWRGLLEDGPADAPWIAPISEQISDLAALAGVDYTPPGAGRGPSAADVAAADDMSEEDRQAMIRTMVEGLNDRLATEGGTAEEWARLIGALGVLGETERAKAIWTEAQGVFAGRETDLATLRAAAERAGVAE